MQSPSPRKVAAAAAAGDDNRKSPDPLDGNVYKT